MIRVAFWCHFSPESRSAAGQRANAFVSRLRSAGLRVVRLGGSFGSAMPIGERLIRESFITLFSRARVHILSVPPYRSVLPQVVLLTLCAWRKVIIDQRDLALHSAPEFEKRVERRLLARASAIIVTTHAQRRELQRRYRNLPPITVIRNGASDDLCNIPRRQLVPNRDRLKAVYQGLVGGKKLSEIIDPLCALGFDLDLVVFLDRYSNAEIDQIRHRWSGPGILTIHSNLDAAELVAVIDSADFALNPIPIDMDYAFTVKTADYASRGIPQLVIGSRKSVSRRIVQSCKLGHGIDNAEQFNMAAVQLVFSEFRLRNVAELRIFRRSQYSDRIVQVIDQQL